MNGRKRDQSSRSMEPESTHRFVDGALQHANGTAAAIVRIQLIRSVRSRVLAGSSVRLECFLASEFCDPVPDLLDSTSLFAGFIPARDENSDLSTVLPVVLTDLNVVPCKYTVTKQYSARFSISFPTDVGAYQLFLFAKSEHISPIPSTEMPIITLPLLSSRFDVVSADELTLQPETMPLLSCYRIVDDIVIEEEYGKMLGSHIYDSSVAILRYITHLKTDSLLATDADNSCPTSNSGDVALELGSGCGLVSIWLAKQKQYHRVIATDMALQLPLIERNILVNGVQEYCLSKALDWCDFSVDENHSVSLTDGGSSRDREAAQPIGGDPTDCERSNRDDDNELVSLQPIPSSPTESCRHLQRKYLDITANEHLELIVAGDVLYSRELAGHFFSVIQAFAEPNVTVILVAQKLRNLDSKDSLDVKSIPGLSSEIVWEEANVIIWRLSILL